MNEVRLQSCVTLFPDHRAFKFTVNHFSGVAVDESSKSIPCQRTFTGGVSIPVVPARPADVLRNSAQIVPNQRFSILSPLISGRVRAARQRQKDGGANEKASDAHGRPCFSVRASTL
jgi:hypothetical protein